MNQTNYNIIIATDSFKGSMTSYEAGDAIATAIKEQTPSRVTVYPVADGGEGTTEALSFGRAAVLPQCITVTGPLGEKVQAKYTIFGTGEEKTAILEMAQAAGLTLVPVSQRNPLKTTTYGVGEMILDAVRKGCKKLIVGIGGSATNDVGIGMLQALGASFTDINDQEVSYGAEGIENIAAMDTTGILKKLKDVDIKVICDVNNPLVGDEGCSTVFAPQKGADLQMVQRMEQAITRFADLFAKDYDRWLAGAGAAGGLGYAFAYFLHAELVHGIDLVLQEIHLEEAVKTIAEALPVCHERQLAYAGCFGDGIEQCTESGLFDRVYAVTEQEGAFDPQMAVRDLGQKVRETMSEWIHMIDTKKGANE